MSGPARPRRWGRDDRSRAASHVAKARFAFAGVVEASFAPAGVVEARFASAGVVEARFASAGVVEARLVRAGVVEARLAVPRGAAAGLEAARTEPHGMAITRGEAGQATILVLGAALALLVGALVLGAVARGIGVRSDEQRAADLAALAGARAMHDAYPRLFEPAVLRLRSNPAHLERTAYLERGRDAGLATARRNGAHDVVVSFPDAGTFAPVRIRVDVRDAIEVGAGDSVPARARAEAELAPPADVAFAAGAGVGEYRGPLATRQGKPMRPDVAAAFDRMQEAARRDGISLVVVSGFRSNAEQAVLFARHPDPKWVAPPGRSLHRLGTELDLGPAAAYGWLAAHAKRFHFIQRYSWERWHYGFILNAGTSSVGFGRAGDGAGTRAMPSFVPARFAAPLARAAQRWNVSVALLGAQLYAESNFNPFARSSAGALGIAVKA